MSSTTLNPLYPSSTIGPGAASYSAYTPSVTASLATSSPSSSAWSPSTWASEASEPYSYLSEAYSEQGKIIYSALSSAQSAAVVSSVVPAAASEPTATANAGNDSRAVAIGVGVAVGIASALLVRTLLPLYIYAFALVQRSRAAFMHLPYPARATDSDHYTPETDFMCRSWAASCFGDVGALRSAGTRLRDGPAP